MCSSIGTQTVVLQFMVVMMKFEYDGLVGQKLKNLMVLSHGLNKTAFINR